MRSRQAVSFPEVSGILPALKRFGWCTASSTKVFVLVFPYGTGLLAKCDILFRATIVPEVIGAVTSVLLIWVVTGVLVYMAVQRIITEEYEINATIMLVTAGVGIIVNIMLVLFLVLLINSLIAYGIETIHGKR